MPFFVTPLPLGAWGPPICWGPVSVLVGAMYGGGGVFLVLPREPVSQVSHE